MKALLQFIIMTSVVTLGSVGWGQTVKPEMSVTDPKAISQFIEAENTRAQKNQCHSLVKEMKAAEAKAKAECRKAGQDISTCSLAAEACASANTSEQSGSDVLSGIMNSAFATQGMPGLNLSAGEYRGQCLSRRDLKDERSSLNSNLEKAEDNISRLQEKITKAKEDADKQKRRANEALQDLMKDAREKDLKDKQEARENSERSQADSLKMQTEIRQLRIEILRDQGNLAKLIGERTRTLAKLSNALIQKNCMEAIEKVRAGLKNLSMGSANAVFNQNRTQRNRLKQDYDSCVKEAQTIRETGRQDADAQIAAAQESIKDKQERISGYEQALSERAKNEAQAQAEQAQSKQQEGQERIQRQMNLLNEVKTIDSTTQEKIMGFQQDLVRAQTKMNKYSNQLATLGERSSGNVSPEDAVAAYEAYVTAHDACTLMCPDSPCGKKVDQDEDRYEERKSGGTR